MLSIGHSTATAPCRLPFTFAMFSKCKEEITKIFEEKVQPIYGDQTFNLEKFEEGRSRVCEVMKRGEKTFGLIAYLQRLQDKNEIENSFEVRNLLLVKDKYNKEKYQEPLYQRVLTLAKDRNASHIHFLVASADTFLVGFLKAKGFVQKGTDTISKDKKAAVILALMLDQATNFSETHGPENDRKNNKRKRGEDELRNDEPANKKTCFVDSRPLNLKPVEEERREQNISRFSRSLSMPDVYHSEPKRYELTLKKIYIHQIRKNEKTIEGRIWSTVRNYRAGDTIRFFYGADPQDDVRCTILKIDKYVSFAEMLEKCGFKKCLPEVRTLEQAKNIYDAIPTYPERARQHGVAAIHLQVIRN